MSSWGLTAPERDEPPVRRVREEVRDSVAVCMLHACSPRSSSRSPSPLVVEARRLIDDDRSPSPPGAARPGRRPGRPGAGGRAQRAGRRDLGPRRAHRGDPDAAARTPTSSGSTATRRRCGWRRSGSQPFAERITLVHAVYDEMPRVLAELGHAAGAGRAVRPRGLVDAARRGRSAASPTRTTRRSTCGWTRRRASPRPRCSTPTRRSDLARVLSHVRRGAVRPPDRRLASCASASASRSTRRPGWST